MKKLLLLLIAVTFASCTSGKLDKFDELSDSGDYIKAKEYAIEEDDDLLWTLQAASASRNAGEFKESNKLLDKAENIYITENKDSMAEDVAEKSGSLLLNDAAMSYKGEIHEGVMINTYKAINFMSLKKWSDARVEVNRAYDRQRRAAEFYASQIQKQQDKLNEELTEEEAEEEAVKKDPKAGVNMVMKMDSLKTVNQYEGYKNYVNPFVNLVEAVFLINKGNASDGQRIRQTSTRLYSMTESLQAQKLATATKQDVFVIIENGKSARKDELRIDLPIGVIGAMGVKELQGNIKYLGVALPLIKEQPSLYNSFTVNATKCDMISDMDKVIKAEYKRALPYKIGEQLVSLTIKTVAQYAASKQGGELAGWGMALLQAGSTHADVRTWSALPKNYHFALGKPGSIVIKSGEKILQQVDAEPGSLVYVKVTATGVSSCNVIKF